MLENFRPFISEVGAVPEAPDGTTREYSPRPEGKASKVAGEAESTSIGIISFKVKASRWRSERA